MFSFAFTFFCTLFFLGLLASLAFINQSRAKKNLTTIRPAWQYMLSIAVYGTSWTFFGSVGAAASNGLGFLPVYLGPTIAIPLWIVLVQKQIRLTQQFRISSMADLLAARYGKSLLIGAVASLIMIIGQIPYITLQIKSISSTFVVLSETQSHPWLTEHMAMIITVILVLISIAFGKRSLDATEKNEGLTNVVIFESAFKILVFLLAGIFGVFFGYSGPRDLLYQSFQLPEVINFFKLSTSPINWLIMTIVSGLAFAFLPHVYQAAVVGNTNEKHLFKVAWMLPLYLLLINIFVIPVAIAGLISFQGQKIAADTFLLRLPLLYGAPYFSILVYLAGLGAGVGMAILAAVALSSMMTNNLFLPVLLNIKFLKLEEKPYLSSIILNLRRFSLAFIFFLAYEYYHWIANQKSLASIGFISFVAIIQLAPAMIGGLFWKSANKMGALFGMLGGFIVWAYALPICTLGESGIISRDFIDNGLFHIALFKPYHLMGMTGLDVISNAAFWSMLVNLTLFISLSLLTKPKAVEVHQAGVFVDILEHSGETASSMAWKVKVSFSEILHTLKRYMGEDLVRKEMVSWLKQKNIIYQGDKTEFEPDPEFMAHIETLIAGVIGQASARVLISKLATEDELSYDDMVNIMKESGEIKKYSAELKVALESVQKLKNQQDGDYFLTTLLLEPFQGVRQDHLKESVNILVKQKKSFIFKDKDYQLGGDITFADSLVFGGERYALLVNADAMGKSIQGAGGALVFSVVMNSLITANTSPEDQNQTPEDWLKIAYKELHNAFITFDGSMFISAVVGVINEKTGAFYYFNAEHPWSVLYSSGHAHFIDNELKIHKLGNAVNETEIHIQKVTLRDGDILLLGSDGRDDVILEEDNSMNENEFRFLDCVKKANADLNGIAIEVQKGGTLSDDFSLLRYQFKKPV